MFKVALSQPQKPQAALISFHGQQAHCRFQGRTKYLLITQVNPMPNNMDKPHMDLAMCN